ncbi:CBS domain-containing protein [Thermoproteota archaeon]
MEAVSDYMTKGVVSVGSKTSLLEVVELMRRHRMGSVLIKDKQDVCGIFTERDLLTRVDFSRPEELTSIMIDEVMTKDLMTVDHNEPYVKVIELMKQKKIRHLPVAKDGQIIGIVSLRDLLDQYESHLAELLREKEKFEAVIHEIGDGIVVCTPDWQVIDINTSALNYLNINSFEDISLIDYMFNNYSVSISRREVLDKSVSHKSFDLIRKETEQTKSLFLGANLDMLKDKTGKITNVALTLRDITDERKEELLKQDFLSLISHKLRTPLTSIGGNILLLQDETLGPLNEKQKERIGIIVDRTHSFRELIDKLIGFTSVICQKVEASKHQPISLEGYFNELRESVLKQKTDKKIKFNINCSDGQGELAINRIHLDLIVMNLIENAIKFNDKKDVKIDIQVRSKSGKTEISISDNGSGIPVEERKKIFEGFYQIEKCFTGNVDGFGLGLALVKRIVNEYDGTIELQSEIGKGTKFVLIFPS